MSARAVPLKLDLTLFSMLSHCCSKQGLKRNNTMIPRKGQKVKRSKSHKIQIWEVGTGRGGVQSSWSSICPTVYRCVINIALNVGAMDETPSANNTMILFDLPQLESGNTLNSDSKLGPVLTRDFNKLAVAGVI